MATKKGEAKKSTAAKPEVEKSKVKRTDARKTPVTAVEREELLKQINDMVTKYNESAQFAEHRTMKKLDEKMAEAVAKYTELAETECYNELKREENPMAAAAMRLSFQTVRTADKKQEDGSSVRVVENINKYIDPLRFYKRAMENITPPWSIQTERLNRAMTAAAGAGLNMNTGEIWGNIKMTDKAKSMGTKFEADYKCESLNADLQGIVDSMVGPGHTVLPQSAKFMLMCHTRAGRASNEVSVANDRSTRQRMLAVCKSALTGNPCYMLTYKKA